MTKVDKVYRHSLEILREHDRDALVEYYRNLDPRTMRAVHHLILDLRDATKRDLQSALDDMGIINDPETRWWQRLRVSIRRRFRQRRYRRRMGGTL